MSAWEQRLNQKRIESRLAKALEVLGEGDEALLATFREHHLLPPAPAADAAAPPAIPQFDFQPPPFVTRDVMQEVFQWNANQPVEALRRNIREVIQEVGDTLAYWTNWNVIPAAGAPQPPRQYVFWRKPDTSKTGAEEAHCVTYLDVNTGLVDWIETTTNIVAHCTKYSYTEAQARTMLAKLASHIAPDEQDHLKTLTPQMQVNYLHNITATHNASDYYRIKLANLIRRPGTGIQEIMSTVNGLAAKIVPNSTRNFSYHREKLILQALVSFTSDRLRPEIKEYIEMQTSLNREVDWAEHAKQVAEMEAVPGFAPRGPLPFLPEQALGAMKVKLNSTITTKAKEGKRKLYGQPDYNPPFSTPFSKTKEFNRFFDLPDSGLEDRHTPYWDMPVL